MAAPRSAAQARFLELAPARHAARLELDRELGQFLAEAQTTGEVRADVVAADLHGLVLAIVDMPEPMRQAYPTSGIAT